MSPVPREAKAEYGLHKGAAMKNILQGNEAIAREAWEAVLVGTFSKLFPEIEDRMWLNALTDLLPKKIHELNVKAFQKGREA